MTSTYTPNLSLELQATGDNPNAWGTHLNTNVITPLDTALGGNLSLSVAGSANVTATVAQALNFFHTLTGALTGNIEYILPATGRMYMIYNDTSGAYTLTVIGATGTGVVVPQGSRRLVYFDGTNMQFAESPWLISEGGTGLTATPTDGQLLVGNTSTNAYSQATLTAGSNITITNGHGSITIAATAGSGTVTSVATGGGLTGGTITTSGTISANQPIAAKTANYTVASTDLGSLITMNSATGTTLTLGAGSLSSGFFVKVSNIGAGSTTLTPSSGTINGATTLVLAQNTGAEVHCDGTNYRTVYDTNIGTVTSIVAGTGLSGGTITGSGTVAVATTGVSAGSYTNASITVNAEGQLTAASSGAAPATQLKSQRFTTSGTFTIPTGVTAVEVWVTGGGANGTAGTSGTSGGAGGGAGATAVKALTGLTPGNTLTVTVGGASAASSISSGTQTITTVSANGGSGSSGATTTSGADYSFPGGDGAPGGYANSTSGIGGPGGTGGASLWGGGGGGGAPGAAGAAAHAYGSGGGGSSDASAIAAAGAGGLVLFKWIA